LSFKVERPQGASGGVTHHDPSGSWWALKAQVNYPVADATHLGLTAKVGHPVDDGLLFFAKPSVWAPEAQVFHGQTFTK
jgi:hypothetical protein